MAIAVTKKPKANLSRARILDAAAALFRDQGYAAVSLRAIAAAAGMQSGSVYYHFGSKEEIVTEVLNLGIERVHDQVSTTIATLPVDADAELTELLRAQSIGVTALQPGAGTQHGTAAAATGPKKQKPAAKERQL